MSNVFQQHGAFSWCELLTSEPEAAQTFYQELFGWTTRGSRIEGMDYTTIMAGEQGIGGIMSLSSPEVQGNPPPHWGVYVTVDDVDASVQKATELGGTQLVAPTDIPDTGRFAVIRDPQGAVFSIISYSNVS